MANLLHLNWSLHSKGCVCFLCTITSYSGRNEILQVKKKKSMLSSVWASTMISLVIELSTRLINKQLSPPVYFLSSLDHCYLCFNNNSKKKTVWSFSLYKQTRLNRSVWMIFGFSGNAALMQLHKIDLFQLHREKNRLLLRAEQSTSGSSPVNIHN